MLKKGKEDYMNMQQEVKEDGHQINKEKMDKKKLTVPNMEFAGFIIKIKIVPWCNGSTRGFDPRNRGSNP